MKTRIRENTMNSNGIKKENISKYSLQNLVSSFIILSLFISPLLIIPVVYLFTDSGILGSLISIGVEIILFLIPYTIYKIFKLFIFAFKKYSELNNIFTQNYKTIDYNIGKYLNIKENMQYYNKVMLQKQFQKYLFWTNIMNAISWFYISFIMIFIFLFGSVDTLRGLWFIFYISLISGLGIAFYIMKSYFHYLYYKNSIEIISFSARPKTYFYSGNIIFFR